ncbi:hypothetical protein Q7P37_005217 [Cladosporium fusiforme]
MPSFNLVAIVGLSFLIASSVAPPPPAYNGERGPFHGPYHGIPGNYSPSGPTTIANPAPASPTGGSSGGPIFPTGGVPTSIVPSGTAIPTIGRPVVPWPTDIVVEDKFHTKRFEGPRHRGPHKPWQSFKFSRPVATPGAPSAPPIASGSGIPPTGTGGTPGAGPTGGPGGVALPSGGPSGGAAVPSAAFPTAF